MMTYIDLLKQHEWFEKCNHILQRDMHKCQDCGRLGYHNGTIYSTDSIDEVDDIINEEILIGDKFSSLIEQTFKGYTECDKVELKKYRDSDGKIYPFNEMEKQSSLLGIVRWEPYHCVKIEKQCTFENLFVYKIPLRKDKGFFFPNSCHSFDFATVITQQNVESLDFKLHRYRKHVMKNGETYSTYPMAILLFNHNLSDKYYLSIESSSISLTYKNYVFYVNLSPFQFVYKGLNVHHKYYVIGKKPWEYDNQALITLCEECHGKRHESNIPVYKSLVDNEIYCYYKRCDRCGGTGYLPQYNHISNGICFKCGGEGAIIG